MMECVDPESGEVYLPRPELRICGHCCQVMQGFASAQGHWLCHPDEGMDCYSAVTLHGHAMRCTICCPGLAYSSTWDEVKAEMARDWTEEQWAEWDRAMRGARTRYASEIRKYRGLDRVRALYRRRKR